MDFDIFRVGSNETEADEAKLKQLSKQICDALEKDGIVYVKNHGITDEKVNKKISFYIGVI